MPIADFLSTFILFLHISGSVYPTRTVLPGMKKKGGGRIVFVSSQVAQVTVNLLLIFHFISLSLSLQQAAIHGYTAYAASKWALRGLAEALQMECRPYGIYVSVSESNCCFV